MGGAKFLCFVSTLHRMKYKGIYFITYAGCGALLSKYVKSAKIVAYGDLGPEVILELEVENFPLTVAIDVHGRSIYGQD